MKVIKSELFYTGGNIWCTDGELDDGTVFCGSDNMGFIIYDRKIYDRLAKFKKEYGDDMELCDICGWDEVEDLIIRYTNDDAEETFDLWTQIYNRHEKECCDVDYLRDELCDIFCKEKTYNVELRLTPSQIKFLYGLISKEHEWYKEEKASFKGRLVPSEDAMEIERDLENICPILEQIESAYNDYCEDNF